jgi:hypothetical protein
VIARAALSGSGRRLLVAVSVAGSIAFSACGGDTGQAAAAGLSQGTGVAGVVSAGSTCPVVQPEREEECADTPLPGANILLTDAVGRPVTTYTSDAGGRFEGSLDPGAYTLAAKPVDGWLGTPAGVQFVVEEGIVTLVDLTYDTSTH